MADLRSGNGRPYAGPADAGLRAQWRRERRAVIRRDHPDRGGDPDVLQQRLAALDHRYRRLETAPTGVRLAPAPAWQPVTRVVRRTVRRLGRVRRAAQRRLPAHWPGRRRYFDL